MSEERVERVARAIFYAEWGEAPGAADGDIWQGMQRSSKRKYLNMARAAIEAYEAGEINLNHT